MKKKLMMMIVTMCAVMMVVPNVHAALQLPVGNNHYENVEVTGDETNGYTITLKADVKQDIEIKQGQVVTIDLAGHKLENFTKNCAALHIEAGAKVTIVDNGTDGKVGEIVLQDDSGESSTVPVIGNYGELNIEGGKIVSTNKGSTGIMNNKGATLNITGGIIEANKQGGGDHEGAAGISNEGTATIAGGTFVQNYEFSVILNAGEMTILDGEFKTGTGSTHYSLITNDGVNIENAASLTIVNGTFESDLIISNTNGNEVEITGGDFQNPENVKEYLAEDLTFDEEGNIVEKPKPTETPTAKPAEKNPDTSDNASLLFGLLALGVCGLGLTAKKRLS